MSFWDWIRYVAVYNLFFWWIALIGLAAASYPLVRRVRLWQARRRFIESQGAKLQNPQNADARFQLASLYAEGGAWRKAADYAGEAVRVAAENPLFEGRVPYHFLRLHGDALRKRGRLDEAAAAYERALTAKSDLGHADALFGLGLVRLKAGETEKAFELLRRAVRENGSRLEGYFRLAQAAERLGRGADVEEAARDFRETAASLPRFARQGRLRWRLAFLFWPLTRRLP
jgi:tetratricopeptide (TPR) repeat protein